MQRIMFCVLIMAFLFGCKKHITPCTKKQPAPVHEVPMRIVHILTANEYNVFKHIVVPEECGEISKDSLHPDLLQAWQHGDTLVIGYRNYKK